MDEVKFSCGSYEQNKNMIKHINDVCCHGNPADISLVDGRVIINLDTLSRESDNVQNAVMYIVSKMSG